MTSGPGPDRCSHGGSEASPGALRIRDIPGPPLGALVANGTLDDVVAALSRLAARRLLSVIVFGSYARGEAKYFSDLDLLAVFDGPSWRPDDEDELARRVKGACRGFYPPLGINVWGIEGLRAAVQRSNPLLFEIVGACHCHYDPLEIMKDALDTVEARLRDGRAYQLDRFAWHLPDVSDSDVNRLCQHYEKSAARSLAAARTLADAGFTTEAVSACADSVHRKLRGLLIRDRIYVSRGELVQIYLNCHRPRLPPKVLDLLEEWALSVEQRADRYNDELPLTATVLDIRPATAAEAVADMRACETLFAALNPCI